MHKSTRLLAAVAVLTACADAGAPVEPQSGGATRLAPTASPSAATAALTPDGVRIVTQPQGTRVGRPVAPAIVVQLLRAGVVLKSAGVSVSVTKATGPGAVAGTLTAVSDTAGKATFANVLVQAPGAYTLRATIPGNFSTTTSTFYVRDLPYASTLLGNWGTTSIHHEVTLNQDVPFVLFTPTKATAATPMPLIVYGHSSGGYVSNPTTMAELLATEGMPMTVTANKANFPAFVLVPQIPTKSSVSRESWRRAIPKIVNQLKADGWNIDLTRIYFIGFSTGGIEGLHLAYQNPTFFAAIVPIDPAFTSLDMTNSGAGTAAYAVMASRWYDAAAYDDGSHGGPDAMGEFARAVVASKTSLLVLHGTSPTEVTRYGTANRDIGDLAPVFAKFTKFGAIPYTTKGSNTTTQFHDITTDKYVYSLFNGTTTGLTHAQMGLNSPSYTANLPLYNWLLRQHR